MTASHTVGGVSETRTVLQRVTNDGSANGQE